MGQCFRMCCVRDRGLFEKILVDVVCKIMKIRLLVNRLVLRQSSSVPWFLHTPMEKRREFIIIKII